MAWTVLICVLAYQSHPAVGSVPRFFFNHSGLGLTRLTSLIMEKISFILMGAGMLWWILRLGKRNGIFFYAPYILLLLSFIFFWFADDPSASTLSEKKDYSGFFVILILIPPFLFEYYRRQLKCPHCGRRTGLKKIDEKNHKSFDHVGTKSFDVKNSRGEKIGEYEGQAELTTLYCDAIYKCKYCGKTHDRLQSNTYDRFK